MSLPEKFAAFFKSQDKAASTLDYLLAAFKPLAQYGADWPERAAEYVLSGGEAALLLELQGKPDGEAALLLDMPARFSPWYYELTEQSRQAHIAPPICMPICSAALLTSKSCAWASCCTLRAKNTGSPTPRRLRPRGFSI